jgi:DNA-binding transcriptional MerR regulator
MRNTNRLPASSVPRYEEPRPVRYTLADLEQETGVNARTIRYYITEGLLQPAYGRGPTATYDPDHLLRLRMIQQLKDERLSLKDIKERLSHLTPEDIAVILKIQMQPETESWRRYVLHPEFEISVKETSPGDRAMTHAHAFDLIIEYARTVLEDLDRPEKE